MATKQLIISDISGDTLDDTTHARVTVEHPDHRSILELDMSVEEAEKLQNNTLRLVNFTVYAPGKPPRAASVETKTLDKLFSKVNFDDVLGGARKAEGGTAPRRAAAPRAASGEKVDYTAADKFGQLHRGRITDREKELVRANPEQASQNRQAQGHPAIDWNDEAEKKRYGL